MGQNITVATLFNKKTQHKSVSQRQSTDFMENFLDIWIKGFLFSNGHSMAQEVLQKYLQLKLSY